MNTLRKLWEDNGADVADGVQLLIDNGGQLVTPGILNKLKDAAKSGQTLDKYLLGKLSDALDKIEASEGFKLTVNPPKAIKITTSTKPTTNSKKKQPTGRKKSTKNTRTTTP